MNKFKSLYYTFRVHLLANKVRSTINPNKRGVRKCFIFLAADYGNLGDVAITYAQKEFLKKKFVGYEICEVYAANSLKRISEIKEEIMPQDIVTIVGGGNMSDLYGDIELLRLIIVKSFPKNRVILFPQTIDYSKTKEAQWLLNLSKKIYTSHQNLTMSAREHVSFQRMKDYYPNVNIKLTPDIVMSLKEVKPNITRKNIATFCLRDDKEKNDNSECLQIIEDEITSSGLSIEKHDTHIGSGRFSEKQKYEELTKLLDYFRQSKLVVTDRLHGMIFAFITGTPAIVLPNSNFKIEGCFEWIKDCGFIKFISEKNDNLDIKDILPLANQYDEKKHSTLIEKFNLLI